MDCEQYQQQISELIDIQLSENESSKVYRHLSTCSGCRSFFRSCIRVKETVPSILYDDTVSENRKYKTSWIYRYVRIPLPAAAVFIVLFFAGLIGTSLHFFQENEAAITERYQIIYISEFPEIEVRLMSGRE